MIAHFRFARRQKIFDFVKPKANIFKLGVQNHENEQLVSHLIKSYIIK
jgi:hypothetical protein